MEKCLNTGSPKSLLTCNNYGSIKNACSYYAVYMNKFFSNMQGISPLSQNIEIRIFKSNRSEIIDQSLVHSEAIRQIISQICRK